MKIAGPVTAPFEVHHTRGSDLRLTPSCPLPRSHLSSHLDIPVKELDQDWSCRLGNDPFERLALERSQTTLAMLKAYSSIRVKVMVQLPWRRMELSRSEPALNEALQCRDAYGRVHRAPR